MGVAHHAAYLPVPRDRPRRVPARARPPLPRAARPRRPRVRRRRRRPALPRAAALRRRVHRHVRARRARRARRSASPTASSSDAQLDPHRAHAPRGARPRAAGRRSRLPAWLAAFPLERRVGCGSSGRSPWYGASQMRRLLASSPCRRVSSCPPRPSPRRRPCPVTLAGTLFNNKPNAKMTIKLGGSLRFIWKNGFHNVAHVEGARGRQEGQLRRPVERPQADHSSSPPRRASTSSTACPTRRSAWC